ncbi:hypothetical protein B0O99DRAFT_526769 [Bisporella sp. PMI_857]|nr:hypothetical protein B0O99DRAFT_526769 [Bisporella sp. PMI_857]
MAFGGVALKGLSLFLRFIQFCCAAIVLGISCYYLAVLHNHGLYIATYIRTVTGVSGAAVIYTILALLLVCCLGGIAVFSLLGILFDLAFTGAFIYVAWAYRGGTDSCSGTVNTPLGSGNRDNRVSSGDGGFVYLPSLYTACKLETAAFAVAIVGIIFFFLSIFVELGLMKHHKKEKAFGPSPSNGYTAGRPKRKFWQRKPRTTRDPEFATKAHPDALPPHAVPADMRTSYATDTTAVGEYPVGHAKYGEHTGVPHGDGYQRSHVPYNQNPTAGTNY